MDDDGFLYCVGRSDGIIRTRAENVSPAEVENALCSIDGVEEATVIGVPEEILGEAIRAYGSEAKRRTTAYQHMKAQVLDPIDHQS